jgi:hypothetical protein
MVGAGAAFAIGGVRSVVVRLPLPSALRHGKSGMSIKGRSTSSRFACATSKLLTLTDSDDVVQHSSSWEAK